MIRVDTFLVLLLLVMISMVCCVTGIKADEVRNDKSKWTHTSGVRGKEFIKKKKKMFSPPRGIVRRGRRRSAHSCDHIIARPLRLLLPPPSTAHLCPLYKRSKSFETKSCGHRNFSRNIQYIRGAYRLFLSRVTAYVFFSFVIFEFQKRVLLN